MYANTITKSNRNYTSALTKSKMANEACKYCLSRHVTKKTELPTSLFEL